MSEQHIICEIDGRGVVHVTLNRPDVHNALSDAMMVELTDVFTRLSDNAAARLVVLSGSGKSFSAGADLAMMKAMKQASLLENKHQAERLAAMFDAINRCAVPVLGVVHGAALGGGIGLVAICDFVLATDGTQFGLTETRLGIVPAVISPYVIAKMGESGARAYFLSGARFDAATALRIGLVHEMVEDASTLAVRKEALIGEFLKAAPGAARMAKELIFALPDVKDVTAHTCELIAHARTLDEGQEGMDAFLNKRTPYWVKS